MPTADDLDNPEGFVRGEPELDLSFLDAPRQDSFARGRRHGREPRRGRRAARTGNGKGDGA